MEGRGGKSIRDAAWGGDRAHRDKAILEQGFVGQPHCLHPATFPLLPAPSRAAQGDVGPLWGILAATSSYCWACPAAKQGTREGTHSAGPTTLSQTQRLALAPEVPSIPHPRVDVVCLASGEM